MSAKFPTVCAIVSALDFGLFITSTTRAACAATERSPFLVNFAAAESIPETFLFSAACINSAPVSASASVKFPAIFVVISPFPASVPRNWVNAGIGFPCAIANAEFNVCDAVAAPGTPNPPAAPNPLTTAPIRLPFDNW